MMRHRVSGRRTLVGKLPAGMLLLTPLLVSLIAAADDPSPTPNAKDGERYVRYGERPLTGADFLAPVPDKRPVEDPRAEAYSHTLVRYEYECRLVKRGGKMRAQLTKIHFYSVFDRDQSWNALPNDQRLLDHHTGHFDIAQIAALQIQLDWQRLLENNRERNKWTASGRTEAEARAELEKKINEQLRGHEETMKRDHQYYDDATRYGTDQEIEARERQRQVERLQQLEQELKEARS